MALPRRQSRGVRLPLRLIAERLVLVGVLSIGSIAVSAADGPQTIVIFDGSGSMWGRLDDARKAAKLDLAREAVRSALAPFAGARLGLVSFGHRRSGDCSDIELIVPPGVGDPPRIMAALDKLNPRGKGPIAGALSEAAKALGTNPQATIILIHDNADNCRQDPCETATMIASANPKLKVHLVALGIEADELERVSCVAKTTGGHVYDVQDANSVTQAVTDAFKLALLDTEATAADGRNGERSAPNAAPSPAAPQPGPPGLALSARLAAGTEPLAVPLQWRVFKVGTEQPVFEGNASQLRAPLPAGNYTVEGSLGFVTASKTVDVGAIGLTQLDLLLDAAALRLTVQDLKDGQPNLNALVTVQSASPTAGSRPLWIGRAGDADFVLPSGVYQVRVSDSLAWRTETMTLAAGAIVSRAIVMDAGHLELSATAKPDGDALDAVTYLIATDDPDAPDGRREIARSTAARPQFALPSGTYYVTARTATAEIRQRVGIGAGDVVKRTISLGLGKLSVRADPSPGKRDMASAAALKQPLNVRVVSLDGEPHEIARTTALTPEFTLGAGRYRIEAAIGTLNVRASQDVELEPGGTKRVSLKLDGNSVSFKFAGAVPTSGLAWELRDTQGRVILRSNQINPVVIAAPGRYAARLDLQDKRIEKTVEVLADGVPRVVEFALP